MRFRFLRTQPGWIGEATFRAAHLLGAVALLGASGCELNPRMSPLGTASEAWSCPKDRLSQVQVVAPAPPEAVPEDVARDPARLALWRSNHPAKAYPDRQYVVTGCGSVAVVRCDYSDHYSDGNGHSVDGWMCDMYGAPGNPGALEVLATQMDTEGNARGAQELRAKAQQLRSQGANPAAPSGVLPAGQPPANPLPARLP
jgi:hypothetical protein